MGLFNRSKEKPDDRSSENAQGKPAGQEQENEQAAGNHRNGSSQKTVVSEDGELVLSIPRDRHGRFDPALIAKYQRRFPGFDEKIIALYARGMSTRDIQAHVGELYGVTISPDLVSVVTDAVIDGPRSRVFPQAHNRLHSQKGLLTMLIAGR